MSSQTISITESAANPRDIPKNLLQELHLSDVDALNANSGVSQQLPQPTIPTSERYHQHAFPGQHAFINTAPQKPNVDAMQSVLKATGNRMSPASTAKKISTLDVDALFAGRTKDLPAIFDTLVEAFTEDENFPESLKTPKEARTGNHPHVLELMKDVVGSITEFAEKAGIRNLPELLKTVGKNFADNEVSNLRGALSQTVSNLAEHSRTSDMKKSAGTFSSQPGDTGQDSILWLILQVQLESIKANKYSADTTSQGIKDMEARIKANVDDQLKKLDEYYEKLAAQNRFPKWLQWLLGAVLAVISVVVSVLTLGAVAAACAVVVAATMITLNATGVTEKLTEALASVVGKLLISFGVPASKANEIANYVAMALVAIAEIAASIAAPGVLASAVARVASTAAMAIVKAALTAALAVVSKATSAVVNMLSRVVAATTEAVKTAMAVILSTLSKVASRVVGSDAVQTVKAALTKVLNKIIAALSKLAAQITGSDAVQTVKAALISAMDKIISTLSKLAAKIANSNTVQAMKEAFAKAMDKISSGLSKLADMSLPDFGTTLRVAQGVANVAVGASQVAKGSVDIQVANTKLDYDLASALQDLMNNLIQILIQSLKSSTDTMLNVERSMADNTRSTFRTMWARA